MKETQTYSQQFPSFPAGMRDFGLTNLQSIFESFGLSGNFANLIHNVNKTPGLEYSSESELETAIELYIENKKSAASYPDYISDLSKLEDCIRQKKIKI